MVHATINRQPKYLRKIIIVSIIRLWKDLPTEVVNSQSLEVFKNKMFEYLGDVREDYLRLPRSNCCMYDNSFLVRGIRIWNALPAEITKAESFEIFRILCYDYYFQNY
ncbi:Protein of unknown function [Cotesia congregata]|uniref:Uncharacterized protein n=1 Tax=Cotesia congregata TaxID=51543 RepID=A0A8J2EME6_COTCN|nr:Protein of unknown function [Cotesia congregata]